MTTFIDAAQKRRLQQIFTLFLFAVAFLLTACATEASPPPGDVPPPGPWPPVAPRQSWRLTTPYEAGDDLASWWKSTFFDSLAAGVYPGPTEARLARALIVETNKARADNGLAPLTEDPLLNRVATAHAFDQALRDYWSHTSPEGMGSRARVLAAAGIEVRAGGENSSVAIMLAESQADGIVEDWEHHTGHRELLLSAEVTRVGIGVWRHQPGEFVHVVQLLMDY